MNIMVVDSQGGGIGRSIVETVIRLLPKAEIIAIGTNSTATTNMVRGLKIKGSTGLSSVIYNADRADIIIAPLGAYVPYGMQGEISPEMATALALSKAKKIAIPGTSMDFIVVPHAKSSLSQRIEDAVIIAGDSGCSQQFKE